MPNPNESVARREWQGSLNCLLLVVMSGQNALKQKAIRILQQRKTYENLRGQLQQQSFNMEQANFTTENIKLTKVTVDAMKSAAKTMKTEYREA